MKYASIVFCSLSLALFCAFGCNQATDAASSGNNDNSSTAATTSGGGPSIVFFYADTLYSQYTEFTEQQKLLSDREARAQANLQKRAAALEAEARQVQEKVQQGLLAPNQIAAEEQRFAQKQQELLIEKERIGQELLKDSQLLSETIKSKVDKVLAEMQAEFGYDFILSYSTGSSLFAVNDKYDISAELVSRLNATNSTESN